jgi:hypothetical protein
VIELAGEALAATIEGALAIRPLDRGFQPLRLDSVTTDHAHRALGTPFVAEATNGVRLRFQTAATTIEVDFSLVISERTAFALNAGRATPPVFDLRLDDQLHDRRIVPHDDVQQRVRFDSLPGATSVVELWLPHNVGVIIHGVRSDVPLAAAPDTRPRWLVHGSSITHDSLAEGPSDTWPAQLARDAGWHLTTLGFRGECHLDPFVARAIAAAPADLITLELGINVHNFQTMRERAFVPAVHGFLQTVRDGHPDTPLTVVSPVFGAEREVESRSTSFEGENLEGDLTLPRIREALRLAVQTRERYRDPAVAYVDGLSLLGAEHAHLFPDGLHPDSRGTGILRARLAPLLALA